jgi:hypothetical protein
LFVDDFGINSVAVSISVFDLNVDIAVGLFLVDTLKKSVVLLHMSLINPSL